MLINKRAKQLVHVVDVFYRLIIFALMSLFFFLGCTSEKIAILFKKKKLYILLENDIAITLKHKN